MSDLPESLNRARAAAHRAAPTTGPSAAIRATSPASPYARDRVEAPSNRPAARTPTLRSRTQDVIRSAPGALTAARERQVYDTTPQDVLRGAQEVTGLPSLARGAGGLVGLATQAGSGFLGPQHALPAAGAVAETALGLAGPMMLPRSAGRVAAPVATEAAQPIQRIAREIGPNGMPIAQSQPFRNSLRGGSSDLREAAGMGASSAASESYPISLLWEGDNIGYNGPWSAWDVTQRPVSSLDIRLAQITGAREVRPHSAAPNTDWTPQDHARRIATLMRERPTDPITIRRIGDNEPMRNADGSVDYAPQVIDGKHRLAAARMRGDRSINVQWEQPRTPPPTTPTGTAPFGDPRAYPPQAWDDFGSLQGGTPEARLRAQEQGFDTGRVLYHGTDKDFPAFDVGQAGTGANAGLREEAVFLTDSPAVADSYLSGGYVRSENARGASADMGDGVARWYGDGAQVMPVHVRNGGDMDYWDWGGGGYSPEQIERALREAREAGRPGVVFRGIRDPGIQNTVGPVGNPRRPSNMVAVFDPSNIRSIFAAFDPAKRDSSDLLAVTSSADGVGAPGAVPRLDPPSGADGPTIRRARGERLGFNMDRVLYRGAPRDSGPTLQSTDGSGGHWNGPGVYTAPHFNTQPWDDANWYARRDPNSPVGAFTREYPEGANVTPLVARGNLVDRERFWDAAWRIQGGRRYGSPSLEAQNKAIEQLRREGFTGVDASDMNEVVIWPDADGQVRNLRSPHAAFDPAKRNSSDLLAGLTAAAPIPIAASALTQQQNTTGRPRGRPGFFGGR